MILRRRNILIVTIHIVFNAKTTFRSAFVTFCLPLPADVASLPIASLESVHQELWGDAPEWPDFPFLIAASFDSSTAGRTRFLGIDAG